VALGLLPLAAKEVVEVHREASGEMAGGDSRRLHGHAVAAPARGAPAFSRDARLAIIEVDAEDFKGLEKSPGISAVYIYVDGNLLRALTKRPFRARLNTWLFAPGLHSVRAVAKDSEGMTSADMVMITVNPATSAVEAVR
jgi:hypothetical protein